MPDSSTPRDPTPGERPIAARSSFVALDRVARRRLLVRSAGRILLSTLCLLALYAALPAAGRSGARAIVELIVGLVLFGVLVFWQVRAILSAEHPELRAVETLAVAVPLLVVVFAFAYLSLAHGDPSGFSKPLNHIGSFYFTVTVLSTVGFGDIAATDDLTRSVVTLQILLDLGLVVGLARTLLFAARLGVERQRAGDGSAPASPG